MHLDHIAEDEPRYVDRDGRVVTLGATYAWRGAHGSRVGKVVALTHRGVPCVEIVALDSGASVVVRCAALVRVVEG